MEFVSTIWLWGLAGLIIPVGIHLLSRKTGRVIRFGSIRHFEDTNTRQFKSIRLNELVLLALRCLLITCLVFLLAGLHFNTPGNKSNWLVIERGLENDPEYSSLTDSLKNIGFEIRSLSAGFPVAGDVAGKGKVDYWSLLQQLKSQPVEQAIVLSYSYLEGFRGKRASLPGHVRWLSRNPDPIEYTLNAFGSTGDPVAVRIGNSNADKTSFYSSSTIEANADSVFIESADTISVAVVYDLTFEHDKNILVAALTAINHKTPHHLLVESLLTSQFSNTKKHNWIAWLSEASPPATGENIIRMDETNVNRENLLVQIKTGDQAVSYLLTQRLNEEVALQKNLAVRLCMTLLPGEKYRDRARYFDKRVLPEKLRWSESSGQPLSLNTSINARSTARYLALALLVILLAERLWALKRGQ